MCRHSFAFAAALLSSWGASAPAAACVLPQTLYFETGSVAITPRSEQALTTLVAWIQRIGDGLIGIRISGHSDRTGGREQRRAISRARAEAVRDRLIMYGVQARLIATIGMGDMRPAVATPDGTAEPDNRRAEIGFSVTQAGMEAWRRQPPTPAGELATCG